MRLCVSVLDSLSFEVVNEISNAMRALAVSFSDICTNRQFRRVVISFGIRYTDAHVLTDRQSRTKSRGFGGAIPPSVLLWHRRSLAPWLLRLSCTYTYWVLYLKKHVKLNTGNRQWLTGALNSGSERFNSAIWDMHEPSTMRLGS